MRKEKVQVTITLEAQLDSTFSAADLAKRVADQVEERLCNPEREDCGALRIVRDATGRHIGFKNLDTESGL